MSVIGELRQNPVTSDRPVLVYGSGRLARFVASECGLRGYTIVVAGRDRERVQACARDVAASTALTATPAQAVSACARLEPIAVVNTAGPYRATAPALVRAAIEEGTHYLDAANEPQSLDVAFAAHEDACRAGVAVLTGFGFGVAASEAVAAAALRLLPEASKLELVLRSDGRSTSSPASRASAISVLASGPMAIREGQRVTVPAPTRGPLPLLTGDVVAIQRSLGVTDITAFVSAGIPAFAIPIVAPVVRASLQIDRFRRRIPDTKRTTISPQTTPLRTVAATAISTGDTRIQVAVSLRAGAAAAAYLIASGLQAITRGQVTPGTSTPIQVYSDQMLCSFLGVRARTSP